MAKSSTSFPSPEGKIETARQAGKPKGTRRRVSPRSVTKADAATTPVRKRRGSAPEAAGQTAEPVVRETVPAAARATATPETTPRQPVTSPPSEEVRGPAEERAAPSPPPRPSAEIPAAAAEMMEPEPVASDAPPARAAVSGSGSGLVEGTIQIHGELLAFGWRQTEQNLAVSRAMLASRSLPEIFALQTAWLGSALGSALTHGLELGRLASDMMRVGLPGR
jgi:hypothetical protein